MCLNTGLVCRQRSALFINYFHHYHRRPWALFFIPLYNMSNYDQLHRQCRTLENLFDAKLTSYSQLVSNITRPGGDIESSGSGERWRDLEAELDELLSKVRLQN